jgi:hypothetical protein
MWQCLSGTVRRGSPWPINWLIGVAHLQPRPCRSVDAQGCTAVGYIEGAMRSAMEAVDAVNAG